MAQREKTKQTKSTERKRDDNATSTSTTIAKQITFFAGNLCLGKVSACDGWTVLCEVGGDNTSFYRLSIQRDKLFGLQLYQANASPRRSCFCFSLLFFSLKLVRSIHTQHHTTEYGEAIWSLPPLPTPPLPPTPNAHAAHIHTWYENETIQRNRFSTFPNYFLFGAFVSMTPATSIRLSAATVFAV